MRVWQAEWLEYNPRRRWKDASHSESRDGSERVQTVMVGGAYLVKGLLQRLGVEEAIDQALTHQPEIEASYGQLAQVLITNRLTFTPEPLVHIADWAAEHGIDRVFGLQAAWLDDDRLGAMLDGLADHQVDIWTAVLRQAVKRFSVPLDELHADTTSVYFEGADTDEHEQPTAQYASPRLYDL
jgi:Domain of unknown function (DUF4277)